MTAPNNGGGSIARTGSATPRGLVVIAVAVIAGLLVLNSMSGGSSASAGGSASATTTTTIPAPGGTDTTEGTSTTDGDATSSTTDDPVITPTSGDGSVPPAGCRPHADVRVQAANGARVGGVAAAVTQALLAQGYLTDTATNLEGREQLAETKIYYVQGWLCEAQEVGQILGITDAQRLLDMPTDPPVEQYEGANVLVVIGLDLADQ